MKILVPIPIDLDVKQVEHIGRGWLSFLTNGQWVEEQKGKLVLREEHCTSHRFDADADNQSPERIGLVKAVQDLREALRKYETWQGKPIR